MIHRIARTRGALVLASAAAFIGCAGTGQDEVSFEVVALAGAAAPIVAGDFTIELAEATVAFGPVYLCASASGSATLCETAQAEVLDVGTFDARDGAPQRLGTGQGLTGQVASASYDHGISWLLTASGPRPDRAAPGGHSARFAGIARRGAEEVPFTAEVDVLPQYQGQRAVPSAAASGTLGADVARLEIGFDVATWLSGVDFEGAAALGGPFAIVPGDPEHNAIVTRMVTVPPSFTFR